MHRMYSSIIIKWYLAYIPSGFAETKEILKSQIQDGQEKIIIPTEAVVKMCSIKKVFIDFRKFPEKDLCQSLF